MRALPWVLLLVAFPAASLAVPVDTGLGPEPYHTWPTLTADMAALAAAHPDLAKLSSIGKSAQGLDLWALEIANFGGLTGEEPIVYLDGTHHGNEPLGMELMWSIAVRLLNHYADDPAMKRIVDEDHIYIVPLVNPDGELRNQRKNLNGVDLNRNYPFHWGEPGCDHDPGSATYCGPSAASEPEVQANVAFMDAIKPDIYVSGHTGSVLFIHPWSWTTAPPPDAGTFRSIDQNFTGRNAAA
ncbi:MAG: hypothetical protein LC624_08405 [Halobacteriales archaeon]|nr:hypothetical protein [Halobacteriales archaeon]